MNELGRYHTEKEKLYREKRKKAVKKIDGITLVDNPFLFANRIAVTDSIARYELYKNILNISGAIVECGVHCGNNLMFFLIFLQY